MEVADFSSSAPLLPIFNGEKYEWWSINIKTLLRSQELWDLVEHEFVDVLEPTMEENERLRETKKKGVKALFIIQQAIHDYFFTNCSSNHVKASLVNSARVSRRFKIHNSEIAISKTCF